MYQIPWWRTSFGQEEVNRISDSVSNEYISQGPVTALFEEQIAEALNIPYVVATTSGSMALLIALMSKGIGYGDEVIVPNQTFIATAHAVLMTGARVVLIDTRPDIPLIDISYLRRKITTKTKAIIPVHLSGRAAEIAEINCFAKEYGLVVIEDVAQALFSRNSTTFLGTQSDAGCFSLGVSKLISTGQGGFVVTQNQETYDKLKLIRSHGITDLMNEKYACLGFNFKFNDLLASVGLEQLNRVKQRIAHVNSIYSKYAEGIEDLPFLKLIPINVKNGEVPLYVDVLCERREELLEFLEKNGIQARRFHPNLHLARYLQNSGEFSNSRLFGEGGMILPCGPAQPLENIDRVIEVLKLFNKSS